MPLPIKRTAGARLETYASISRVQSDEEMHDLERSVVAFVVTGAAADRCDQCGAGDRTLVPVDVGNREIDDVAMMPKLPSPAAWMFTVREIGKGRSSTFAALDYRPATRETRRPSTAGIGAPDDVECAATEEILNKSPLFDAEQMLAYGRAVAEACADVAMMTGVGHIAARAIREAAKEIK